MDLTLDVQFLQRRRSREQLEPVDESLDVSMLGDDLKGLGVGWKQVVLMIVGLANNLVDALLHHQRPINVYDG